MIARRENLEARKQTALNEAETVPMPSKLIMAVANAVQPFVEESYRGHGHVMTSIAVAYPIIKKYLAEEHSDDD